LATLAASLRNALLITSFVFIMMVVIEYVNVQTSGAWQRTLRRSRGTQYALAAVLGAVPGCLGAFTVVSLYAHRAMTFGALVTAMIATSGDEAFVMFSMFPGRALALTAVLFALGWLAGFVTDEVIPGKGKQAAIAVGHELDLHETDDCRCFNRQEIVRQLKAITFQRALLLALLLTLLGLLVESADGWQGWDWVRLTLLAGVLFALFVTITVPDHFLYDHLWEHILKRHVLQIFAWTFGALLVIGVLGALTDVESWVRGNNLAVVLVASLVGLIPQSGPHLLFVTLYAQGAAPFSVLLANSIVQDGHGTLPLLALSKRGFVRVKLVNLFVGIAAGIVVMLLGH
jgi:hypothetical protein